MKEFVRYRIQDKDFFRKFITQLFQDENKGRKIYQVALVDLNNQNSLKKK